MSEQKTVQQQMREQYKVVEDTTQDVMRAWNDLALATTEFSFDVAQKSMSYGLGLRGQSERVAQEALAAYRQVYQDSFRAWQGYIQGVNEIIVRSTRN